MFFLLCFRIVQSEFYGSTDSDDPKLVEPSYADGLIEVRFIARFAAVWKCFENYSMTY